MKTCIGLHVFQGLQHGALGSHCYCSGHQEIDPCEGQIPSKNSSEDLDRLEKGSRLWSPGDHRWIPEYSHRLRFFRSTPYQFTWTPKNQRTPNPRFQWRPVTGDIPGTPVEPLLYSAELHSFSSDPNSKRRSTKRSSSCHKIAVFIVFNHVSCFYM